MALLKVSFLFLIFALTSVSVVVGDAGAPSNGEDLAAGPSIDISYMCAIYAYSKQTKRSDFLRILSGRDASFGRHNHRSHQ